MACSLALVAGLHHELDQWTATIARRIANAVQLLLAQYLDMQQLQKL